MSFIIKVPNEEGKFCKFENNRGRIIFSKNATIFDTKNDALKRLEDCITHTKKGRDLNRKHVDEMLNDIEKRKKNLKKVDDKIERTQTKPYCEVADEMQRLNRKRYRINERIVFLEYDIESFEKYIREANKKLHAHYSIVEV